jgi:hypothetical protein
MKNEDLLQYNITNNLVWKNKVWLIDCSFRNVSSFVCIIDVLWTEIMQI